MSHASAAASFREFFLCRAGYASPGDWLAETLAENTICGAAAKLLPELRGASPIELSRAIVSSDLGLGLTSALQHIASVTSGQSIAHRAVLRALPVRDFRPNSVPVLATSDLEVRPEAAEWASAPVTGAAALEAVEVQDHKLRFLLSRESLINDSVGALAALAASIGAAAARAELAALASVLENTSTLSDGVAFFDSSAGNVLTGSAAPSITSLNAAAPLLRRQPLPGTGSPSCAEPAFIIVPPELEFHARVVATETGSELATDLGLQVIVLPGLTSATTWYLASRPEFTPALALLYLADAPPPAGQQPQTVSIDQAPRKPTEDGLALWARSTFRIARLSRYGAIKIIY